jgi:hypothetical protein
VSQTLAPASYHVSGLHHPHIRHAFWHLRVWGEWVIERLQQLNDCASRINVLKYILYVCKLSAKAWQALLNDWDIILMYGCEFAITTPPNAEYVPNKKVLRDPIQAYHTVHGKMLQLALLVYDTDNVIRQRYGFNLPAWAVKIHI